MPLRTRLQNTGLRLKIPVRSNTAVTSSPYGPSPNRHSASPSRKKDPSVLFPRPPGAEANTEAGGDRGGQTRVVSFDASVDSRPVWAVTSVRPGLATRGAGFREIPITRTSQHQRSDLMNDICDNVSDEDEPRTPPLHCDVSPEVPGPFLHRSPLRAHPERRLQRAEILRDWMHSLPIGPNQKRTANPFFSPRKKDFNYEPDKYLSSPLPKFNQSPDSPASSVGTSNEGSILTPTEVTLDNPLHSRRDSSGVLQSPDVLDPAKEDGFYLLKKDSQRRTTLVKIMKDDKHNICATWHALVVRENPETCVTIQHLFQLMDGIKAWLPEQNVQSLQATLSALIDALDFDGAKINQLNLALYRFQDAVKTVLRKHQIKPHWMFALDNLVGSAIQAVILVLQPELGAILVEQGQPDLGLLDQAPTNSVDQGALRGVEAVAGHDLHDMEVDGGTGAESTSGVSTVNSGLGGHRESAGRLVSRLNRVRGDNRQLLTDLLRAQADYHTLLKQSLAEQKLHLQMLSQNLAASSIKTRDTGETGVPRPAGDRELVTWLQNLAIDDRSVDIFLGEDLTLNDVLELMNRDDLKRLGLKAGPELRIWRAILRHRGIPTTPTTPNP